MAWIPMSLFQWELRSSKRAETANWRKLSRERNKSQGGLRADSAGDQTHGYEVDLVGARQKSLILALVKSFLGS
jgi:hypothetical protein